MVTQGMTQFFYTAFRTKLGWVALLGSNRGLRRVTLSAESPDVRVGLALWGAIEAGQSDSPFGDLPDRLCRYFEGEPVRFDDELDLSGATPFRRAVWEATRSIPYGETRSYSWVAERAGSSRAARAVGQALAENPFLIVVPCHRVVSRDGSLGGFGVGVDMKRRLLDIEGAAMAQP